MTEAPEREGRLFHWAALIPALLAVVAYLWVLDGWFLYDDFTQGYLLKHDAPGIDGNWGPVLRDFGRAQFGIEDWVYYRAMMSVYLTACLELLGVDPVKLHAVNLCHHAILAFLVASLCAMYCRRHPALAALCGGSWFALHPVSVEAIAWFSANTVTFELLARLGAIFAFAVHLRTRGKTSLVCALGLAALGLVTKESAINVVLGLVAVHVLSTPRPTLGELARKQLVFVPIWIGYFLLRYFALGMFFGGAEGGAGNFLAMLPVNGPIQARLVFLPFGGELPDGVLLVAGCLLPGFALWRGVSSRAGRFVLVVGALWLASQFMPTALNRVFGNLGGSRAHYGTLAGAALWLTLLVFGRNAKLPRALPWLGAAIFSFGLAAFVPVRLARQARFEEAWAENRAIHARLVARAEQATPERPVAVVHTPYDHAGVPQLNRTAHFTLCEVPFTRRDYPVLGLTSVLDEGGLGTAMLHDMSPLRAVHELGGTLLFWLRDKQTFLAERRSDARPPPSLSLSSPEPRSFVFEQGRVSPYEVEEVVLHVGGRPSGGRLSWGTQDHLVFGAGEQRSNSTVFEIDLTHSFELLATQLTGGIDRFEVRFDPEGDFDASLRVRPRLPELMLHDELAGRAIVFGHEHEHLRAPELDDSRLELRLVLLAPNEPIEITEIEPGEAVVFPRRLRSEFIRLLRLSRQKRYYYYFEARSPKGRAIGGARSKVDWFHLSPGGGR